MEKFEPIGKSMLIINKYMKMYIKEHMKKHNLNYGEVMALLKLYERNCISPDYIVDELQYDKAFITRITGSLEEKGLLVREKNLADNRSVIFSLTDKAQELKPHILNILREWRNIMLKDISEEKLKILFSCMSSMVDNISKHKY